MGCNHSHQIQELQNRLDESKTVATELKEEVTELKKEVTELKNGLQLLTVDVVYNTRQVGQLEKERITNGAQIKFSKTAAMHQEINMKKLRKILEAGELNEDQQTILRQCRADQFESMKSCGFPEPIIERACLRNDGFWEIPEAELGKVPSSE